MRVFAYCCLTYEKAARRAAGTPPYTSPPLTAGDFNLAWLANRELIFFDLHGEPGQAEWYGEDRIGGLPYRPVALTAGQLRQADLGGAVVFALSCYLADEGSPMLDALLDAGARYVIGGEGANWAGAGPRLFGAGLLGLWFRRGLEIGQNPLQALTLAKRRLKLSLLADRLFNQVNRARQARDTLAFRAYYRPEGKA